MQMADQIVLRSVASLIPYARNARTHSEAQVAQIAGSIREFGVCRHSGPPYLAVRRLIGIRPTAQIG